MNTIKTLVFTLLVLCAGMSQAAEQVTYYHNNMAGSPIAATDESGALLWEQAYDPWGEPLLATADSRTFTGAPRDANTALVDMQMRWYSPGLGRMLALDPPGFRVDSIQSFNLYAYGNNNPYRYTDPTGKSPIEIATEVLPAAGESFAALAAYTVGVATGNVHLQSVALQGMREQRTDSIIALASIVGPPGSGKALRAGKAVAKSANGMGDAISVSKKGLKHLAKHTDDFKQFDNNFSIDDQVALGKSIASDPKNFVNEVNGSRGFEAVVKIGGTDVKVRSVLNASGNLRTVYPLKK